MLAFSLSFEDKIWQIIEKPLHGPLLFVPISIFLSHSIPIESISHLNKMELSLSLLSPLSFPVLLNSTHLFATLISIPHQTAGTTWLAFGHAVTLLESIMGDINLAM